MNHEPFFFFAQFYQGDLNGFLSGHYLSLHVVEPGISSAYPSSTLLPQISLPLLNLYLTVPATTITGAEEGPAANKSVSFAHLAASA